MSTQPEALRLANDLDRTLCVKHGLRDRNAADELRRLHAVNAELLWALQQVDIDCYQLFHEKQYRGHKDNECPVVARINAAIAKAEEVKP